MTGAEVAAQQVRDSAADAERDLNDLAGRLGLEPAAGGGAAAGRGARGALARASSG